MKKHTMTLLGGTRGELRVPADVLLETVGALLEGARQATRFFIEGDVRGEKERVLADRALLDTCVRFARAARDGFEGVQLEDIAGLGAPLVARRDDVAKIEMLRDETPGPKAVRVSGTLDTISATKSDVVLTLSDGTAVGARLDAHDTEQLKALFGSRVVMSGMAQFREDCALGPRCCPCTNGGLSSGYSPGERRRMRGKAASRTDAGRRTKEPGATARCGDRIDSRSRWRTIAGLDRGARRRWHWHALSTLSSETRANGAEPIGRKNSVAMSRNLAWVRGHPLVDWTASGEHDAATIRRFRKGNVSCA